VDQIDALIATWWLKVAALGASFSFLGHLLSSGLAAFIGAAAAVLGLGATCIFGWRQDRRNALQDMRNAMREAREQEEHEARMKERT
jgi:hypothetical protein